MSGDMFLAALFSLGADVGRVRKELGKLGGIESFEIELESVKKKGLAASKAVIGYSESSHERNLKSILEMIDSSGLDSRVKELSSGVFYAIAEAEGKVHGISPDKVHFHEVGAVDSIIDIVGAVLALEELGFPEVYHRPFVLGRGTIDIAHGRIPLPAPATIELLKGRSVSFVDEPFEIVTPTAAALMKVLARGIPPGFSFTPERVVYSVGTREGPDARSMLRVIEASTYEAAMGDVVVLRATIDDMNPEIYSFIQESLLGGGALEVYLTQVIMKKGRPGTELTVLCREDELAGVVDFISRQTTTIGMRVSYEKRVELERRVERLDTPLGEVEVKLCRLPDGSVKGAPEYESCRRVASEKNLPLKDVYSVVQAAIDSFLSDVKQDGERSSSEVG